MRRFTLILLLSFAFIIAQAQVTKKISTPSGEKEKISVSMEGWNLNTTDSKIEELIDFQPNHQFIGRNSISKFKVLQKNEKGLPSFISGVLSPTKRSDDLMIQGMEYIDAVSNLMNLKNNRAEFDLLDQWEDDLGEVHLKYQQTYSGIPIYGSEIILHAKDQVIHSLNGRYTATQELADINVIPTINQDALQTIVKEHSDVEFKKLALVNDWMSKQVEQWENQLVFFKEDQDLILANHMKVYPHLGEWLTYFIDANSGKVLKTYSNLCKFHGSHEPPPDGPTTANAQDLFGNTVGINTYEVGNNFYMIDGSRTMFNTSSSNMPDDPVGAIWTIDAFDTSPQNNDFNYGHVATNNNSWNHQEAVSAHANAGQAYEYFKNTHGRESIDGGGGTIISFVNVADENGLSMGNAFWNGIAIFYGNGSNEFFPLGRGLDVAGHELSHGVVQKTANLEYYGESGAMNESFADIFGVMIDRDDWLVGEDVVKQSAFPSGALRSMQDPHNGASTGDFNAGWQPSHVNEKFNGPEDNNGVHINSGIPNHAFYLFANQVGKDKAEKVYYRALTNYLTKSSQFTDLRIAVEKSAGDLYGATEVNAANNAFDQVGIAGGQAGNYQEDADLNPGQDLVLYTNPEQDALFISLTDGTEIANPLSSTSVLSKPSITDDGSEIVFIGKDKKMYNITIDWQNGSASEQVLNDQPIWRNVVVSKDGKRLAALADNIENTISVFDLEFGGQQDFELYNPTYTQGISTGDVLYADVMEFDISGSFIMYDAANEIESQTAGTIQYWDIGFLEVWNNSAQTWALGNIEKAFPALPEGVSVGNPTFAKNSPYVIAFDFIDETGNQILGANLETGDVGLIFENTILGYPSYSRSDAQIIYDISLTGYDELGIAGLNNDKITALPNSENFLFNNPTPSKWGVWFSNGERDLTKIEDIEATEANFKIFPNPVSDQLKLSLQDLNDVDRLEIYDLMGRKLLVENLPKGARSHQISTSSLLPGTYVLGIVSEDKRYNTTFVVSR